MDNKENDVTNEEYTFDFGFDDLGEEPRPNEQDNSKNGVYSDDDGNIYFPSNEEYTFDFGFDDLGEEPRPNEQDNLKNGVYSDDDGNIYFPSNEEYTFDFKLDESEEEPISIEQDNSKNGVYSDDDGNIFFPLNEKSLDSTDTDESTNKKGFKLNKEESNNITKKEYHLPVKLIKNLTIFALTGTVILGGTLFLNKHIKKVQTEKYNQLVEYYGENSKEKEVIDYISLSEQLHDLDLDSYIIPDNFNSIYSTVEEGLYPIEDTKELIILFNECKKNFSVKDLANNAKFTQIILLLRIQEIKINGHIYKVGYSVANIDVSKAAKSYAAEYYGLDNPNNIKLFRLEDLNYIIESLNSNGEVISSGKVRESNIIDGIDYMANTNIDYDKNLDDNYSYNHDRNRNILEAIGLAKRINDMVKNKDLYNERAASKIK